MSGTGLTRALTWGVGPRVMRRVPDDWVAPSYDHLKLEPCGEVIGAEVRGVDLSEPPTDAIRDEIRHALLEWKVLFFRGQHLTSAEQLAFARAFGELEQHPFLPPGDTSEVVRFEKGDDLASPLGVGTENGWHTDVTWRAAPAMGAVLRAIEVPEQGGDTLWADMACAYDNLPSDLRERIDDMRAVHSFVHVFGYGMTDDEAGARCSSSTRRSSIRSCAPIPKPVAARCTSTRSSPNASSAATTTRANG